ncbi:MAG: hypothetical protein RKO24_16460 [Candidatus Competibacter sp.]|nr:hypothetical protein [Candidatus Competibacter sp.]
MHHAYHPIFVRRPTASVWAFSRRCLATTPLLFSLPSTPRKPGHRTFTYEVTRHARRTRRRPRLADFAGWGRAKLARYGRRSRHPVMANFNRADASRSSDRQRPIRNPPVRQAIPDGGPKILKNGLHGGRHETCLLENAKGKRNSGVATMETITQDGQKTVWRRPMINHESDSGHYRESSETSEIAEVVEREFLQLLDLLNKEPEIFLIY